MFGLFGKRKPRTAMDAVILQIYGSLDRQKTADVEAAGQLAYADLLCEGVEPREVSDKARALFAGPMPYSTHDLALSVALAFFKDPQYRDALREAQLVARMQVFEWAQDGKVAKPLAAIFEETLYSTFKQA